MEPAQAAAANVDLYAFISAAHCTDLTVVDGTGAEGDEDLPPFADVQKMTEVDCASSFGELKMLFLGFSLLTRNDQYMRRNSGWNHIAGIDRRFCFIARQGH